MITSVFMGTPEAAVPVLRALNGVSQVGLVVTRPDRPKGRNRRTQPPPVKEAALEMGLHVVQPSNTAELGDLLANRPEPDVGVVVAFGMILRPEVLDWPRRGFVNLHFSRLPRWRGAAPVERAIMAGDDTTGVSVMAMDEGLDTGAIVAERVVQIAPGETGGELTTRLAGVGAELLATTVGAWVRGELSAAAQPDDGATYAHKIGPTDRRLDTTMTRRLFVDTVRALAPNPGAQLEVAGEDHKVLSAMALDDGPGMGRWEIHGRHPVLGLADGAVTILEIQPPGKRPMDGAAWLRGRPLPGS